MRSILFALGLLFVLPAHAGLSYRFSGTCTERLFLDKDSSHEWVSLPCEALGLRIDMPDDYVPGTELAASAFDPWLISARFSDSGWGDVEFSGGMFGAWSYVITMPGESGPASVFLDFYIGSFVLSEDGSWRLTSEGVTPTYYDIRGVDGAFTLVDASQVPLPGTLALLAAGAIILAARRR